MPLYIISGEPVSWFKPRNLQGHTWNNLKELKQKAISQLEDQYQKQPTAKPISMQVNFIFAPQNNHHKSSSPYGYNHSRPDITDLIKFVESVSRGILYTDNSIIASMSCCKRYGELPRTEIIITELSNEKDNEKK